MDKFLFEKYLLRASELFADWKGRWEEFECDPSLEVDPARLETAFGELTARLGGCYPFFHPSYIGQMLKPPHPVAMIGYLAAMQINPNNHALDGGPATSALEKEAVAELARMTGFDPYLGHLTSSGTVANLEALWVARQIHPGKRIAFSDQAHYTHRRMCELLGVPFIEVPSDASGCMDAGVLRRFLYSEEIGTVVVTMGTTGLGAVDPLREILDLRAEVPFRIHADAAYGGFYTLLREEAGFPGAEAFRAFRFCDSAAIDPHKHGLQPYGCGCVLFRDPSVGLLYKHDSPYTYFTSEDLHLGEISLECSRAGAAAAALWLTLKCFPLAAGEGFGPILRACRRAAASWADLIRTSSEMYLAAEPMLDIVAWFPKARAMQATDISDASRELFRRAMTDPVSPKYLSTFRMETEKLRARYPNLAADAPDTIILRSVLMKPEQAALIPRIHAELEEMIRGMRGGEGGGEG